MARTIVTVDLKKTGGKLTPVKRPKATFPKGAKLVRKRVRTPRPPKPPPLELLPCPFCGGKPDHSDSYDKPTWGYVCCNTCDITIEAEAATTDPEGDGPLVPAVVRWNTRVAPPVPTPQPVAPTPMPTKITGRLRFL